MTDNAVWTEADLVAIDLEGSGPQDPAGEAILEIALVPMRAGRPLPDAAFATLINPGRRIRRGPWISPGINNEVLAAAPTLDEVAPTIEKMLHQRVIVGHNVRVDWRLVRRHVPGAAPAGLIDTLRLARALNPSQKGHSLTAWVERLDLATKISDTAAASQPHRALWDATAAALLLPALTAQAEPALRTFADVAAAAAVPLDAPAKAKEQPDQATLWDLP